MKQQTTCLPVLSNSKRLTTNSQLGRSLSNASVLSSFHRIFLTSSCSNPSLPSRSPLKKVKPDAWQRLLSNKSREQLSESQADSSTDIVTNKDFLATLQEHSVISDNSQQSLAPTLQIHFTRLHEQINDITIELAEERIQHKQSRTKTQELLAEQAQEHERKLQQLRQSLKADHSRALKEQEEKFFILLQEEKTESLKREEQLKDELAFVKKSFHAFKISIEKEKLRERQLQEAVKLTPTMKNIFDKNEDIYFDIDEPLITARKHSSVERKNEIEKMKEQHEKELRKLRKILAETAVDRERLESLNKQLSTTKLELDETKRNAINLAKELEHFKSQPIIPTQKLNGYR